MVTDVSGRGSGDPASDEDDPWAQRRQPSQAEPPFELDEERGEDGVAGAGKRKPAVASLEGDRVLLGYL